MHESLMATTTGTRELGKQRDRRKGSRMEDINEAGAEGNKKKGEGKFL